ncbi:hypothetical protein EVAR_43432_1 [Eumeta japonica]|uniref:Uncharacterized protein n=1 Tax=Eumeta variegata TaxID=151549 RepID=A0A4C1WWL1_EUMVA|nr:hypothetical protein EVAR_43432_1 [Eumeta japonica]
MLILTALSDRYTHIYKPDESNEAWKGAASASLLKKRKRKKGEIRKRKIRAARGARPAPRQSAEWIKRPLSAGHKQISR